MKQRITLFLSGPTEIPSIKISPDGGLFIGWRAWRDCAARPKSLRAILSNLEFSSDPTDPPSIKKARCCGLFLWMARLERFELPTARFVAEYSIQLSYRRIILKARFYGYLRQYASVNYQVVIATSVDLDVWGLCKIPAFAGMTRGK
jgi:hypothetical protein